MKEEKIAQECLDFIHRSPSSFHAVANIAEELERNGYQRLEERKPWKCANGGKYYVTRNDSSLIAFHLPKSEISGFHIMASHSDSPTFKIKENAEIYAEKAYVLLNTEKYGGMVLSSWLDRCLSVAGRVVVKGEKGMVTKLVNVDADLCVIPNMAIHMNRDVNKGYEYNPQTDMLPLYGLTQSKDSFRKRIADAAGVEGEEILGSDLFLYIREKGKMIGAQKEFLFSPRLDDLECAFISVKALTGAAPLEYIPVCAVFDNEEVGSQTKQGAGSTFLKDTLENMGEALGRSGGVYRRLLADSFMISADNAHAVHPNHPEKADPTNKPLLNGGIVIKYHGGAKYTTDAYSEAVIKDICCRAEVPVQTFANRSDTLGGSTLGNISAGQVSINSVDIGLAQLAMHSAVETAGVLDAAYLLRAAEVFFQ